jgi:uncharacterized protein YndB with AHSA1/START domain
MNTHTAQHPAALYRGRSLQLHRAFRQPVEKLWAALITPARIAAWMGLEFLEPPASLQAGDRFDFRFTGTGLVSLGHVLRCEPHIFEYQWFDNLVPGGTVRWELTPQGTGCRLTLTETFGAPEDAARQAAGWTLLLNKLAGTLDGASPSPQPDWHDLRDRFATQFPPDAMRDARLSITRGHAVLRFQRVLAHDPACVWQALTAPEAIARWLQADAIVDAHENGRFHLSFHGRNHHMHGQITIWQPPRVLEYSWTEREAHGDSLVRFELTPAPQGTVLILTHDLRAGGDTADFASGWHWHLDALDAALRGETSIFDEPRWHALRHIYQATL